MTYKLGKNVSVGAGLGYRKAEVNTSGIQTSSATTWTKTYSAEYNPNFDFNGLNLKGKFILRF